MMRATFRQYRRFIVQMIAMCCFSGTLAASENSSDIAARDATAEKIADGFHFTEGPAVDRNGDLYFVDIRFDPVQKARIHRWNAETGEIAVFAEKECQSSGLFFDAKGALVSCESVAGCIATYDRHGNRAMMLSTFGGKRFNQPNDLWIAPNGSIYFTDPLYSKDLKDEQGGEYVYMIRPERGEAIRVDKALRPNGIVGASDGKTLYVADPGAKKIFQYDIDLDGTLKEKKTFAEAGSDGMALDQWGNLYATWGDVIVFDRNGHEIRRFPIPESPTNVCFGGRDSKSLFVTTMGKSLYRIRMNVRGDAIAFPSPVAQRNSTP